MATNNSKRNNGNGNGNNTSKGKGSSKRRIIAAAKANDSAATVYLPAINGPVVIEPVAPATATPNTGNGDDSNTVHAAVLQAMQALGIKAPTTATSSKATKANKANKTDAATPTPTGAALLNYTHVVGNNAEALALFTQHIWQGIAKGRDTTCKLYNYLRDELGWRRLPGSVAFRAFVQSAGIANFTVAQHGKRTLTTVSLPAGKNA